MANNKAKQVVGLLVSSPQRWLVNIIAVQEKKQYHFYVILIFALFVALVRYMLEVMVSNRPLFGLNLGMVHMLVFYLHCIFIYTFILGLFIPNFEWKKSIHLVLIGVFLGIFPPIIDSAVYGIGNFHYGYVENISRDWRLWIYNKDASVPIGEALVLHLTMFFTAVVIWIKTGNRLKTMMAWLTCYFFIFLYSALLPSFALMLSAWSKEITSFRAIVLPPELMHPALFSGFSGMFMISLVQLLLCVVIYLVLNPVLLKKIPLRLNHAIPVGLTGLLGYAVIGALDFYALLLFLILIYASVVVIVQNDFFDKDEDQLNGRTGYVSKDDVLFFNTILLILIGLLMTFGHYLAYMLLLFFIVSVIYNHDFYRGKKYFPANYKVEGVWGLSAFVAGVAMAISSVYLLAGDALNIISVNNLLQNIQPLHEKMVKHIWSSANLWMAFLVFGGWSIISVIKDYKDIESDLQAGNQNAYTLLLKKGKNIDVFHKRYTLFLALMMLIPFLWLYSIKAHFFNAVLLALLSIIFYFVINRKASAKTVEIALGIVNLYLLNLVLAAHFSHN